MTTPAPEATNKISDRIAKLLELANGGATQAERDSALDAAQHLATKHAIDMSLVRKGATTDEISQRTYEFTGTMAEWYRDIAATVVTSNSGYSLVREVKRTAGSARRLELIVIAHESDHMLIAALSVSLQLQASSAMAAWEKDGREGVDRGLWWMTATRWDVFRARRTFLKSFRSGVATKLAEARDAATTDAVNERAYTSKTAKATVRESVEVALRSRRDSVSDWVDTTFGDVKATRVGRQRSGGVDAARAGAVAGSTADTGQTTVSGGALAIEG